MGGTSIQGTLTSKAKAFDTGLRSRVTPEIKNNEITNVSSDQMSVNCLISFSFSLGSSSVSRHPANGRKITAVSRFIAALRRRRLLKSLAPSRKPPRLRKRGYYRI